MKVTQSALTNMVDGIQGLIDTVERLNKYITVVL